MKIKKILPLVTIASTTAIATPLIASCSDKGFNYKYNFEYSETKQIVPYEPTITPKAGAKAKYDDIKPYLKDISDNNMIFIDDLLTFYTRNVPTELKNDKLISLKLTINSINVENCTISGAFEFIYDVPITPEKAEFNRIEQIEKITFHNLQFRAVGYEITISERKYEWMMSGVTDIDILANDKTWFVNAQFIKNYYKNNIKVDSSNTKLNLSYKSEGTLLQFLANYLTSYFMFNSNYYLYVEAIE